jgi:ankyrin repeat protein
MNKFALIFVAAAMIASAVGAPRTRRAVASCVLDGDVNANLLALRFNEDSDFECMKKLVGKGADCCAKDSWNYTPLMYAVKGSAPKAIKAVKFIINKSAATLNAKNYFQTTALELAVTANNGAIVKFLLEKGAEGDLSKLLMKAVRDNRELTEAVKVLVNKGADINMVSGAMDYPYVNDSVLIIAAQNNYMEIVKFLLAKGAKHDVKCMSRSWNLGKTPLIFAAMYGKLDIVKTLVTKGADVNVKDLAGNSALMMAAKNGHETVTEFLLSKAANVNYVNDDGYTALIYATESGQGHIVEQLKAKGAYMVDSYMYSFADLFPSFISDPVQRLRRLHRDNHIARGYQAAAGN